MPPAEAFMCEGSKRLHCAVASLPPTALLPSSRALRDHCRYLGGKSLADGSLARELRSATCSCTRCLPPSAAPRVQQPRNQPSHLQDPVLQGCCGHVQIRRVMGLIGSTVTSAGCVRHQAPAPNLRRQEGGERGHEKQCGAALVGQDAAHP